MTRPRLRDVAKEAGVSIGAASDALAGKNQISEETRQRVREAAERLGYVPNALARAMNAGHLNALGLVVGALRRPGEYAAYRAFWSDVIGAGTLAATDRGYGLMILPGLESEPLAHLPMAGMILIDTLANDPFVDQAFALGIPVMTDASTRAKKAAIHVDIDFASTVATVMDHFVAHGSRKPALLLPDVQRGYVDDLERAYRRWCTEHALDPVVADSTMESDFASGPIEWLLDQGVDAVYVTMPVTGALLEAAQRRGLDVGRDLLIASLDEDTDRSLAQADITTVNYAVTSFIEEIVASFIDVIEGRAEPGSYSSARFELLARGSTLGTRHRRRSTDVTA